MKVLREYDRIEVNIKLIYHIRYPSLIVVGNLSMFSDVIGSICRAAPARIDEELGSNPI